MLKLVQKYDIPLGNIIAVGDSEYDICMVRFAGIGVAFCSNPDTPNTTTPAEAGLKTLNYQVPPGRDEIWVSPIG